MSRKLVPSARGVGYLGEGPYTTRTNGEKTKAYLVWYSMLTRCYSDSYHSKDSYSDCYVCDEWLNYQNFAKWFEENYIEGFQLDKDKLVKGNRVYSPETCCFISKSENITLANTKQRKYSLISPKGDIVKFTSIKNFCEENGLDRGSISRVTRGINKSHKGWRHNDTTNS